MKILFFFFLGTFYLLANIKLLFLPFWCDLNNPTLRHSQQLSLLKRRGEKTTKTRRKAIATRSSSPACNLSAPDLPAVVPTGSEPGKARLSRPEGVGARSRQKHELPGQQQGRGFSCK